MTLMTFDSEPATPAPRIRLLHTHRGHILGVRVPGKPYPVLPSAAPSGLHSDVNCLARATFEQTGLVVQIAAGGSYMDVFGGSVILGGVLRPSAGFFHPSEFATSPDRDFIGGMDYVVPPLTFEQVSLYPHEVSPGDRYLFPIVGTRYERTIDGDEGVSFCYESYAEVALGRDDSFASDDAADDESEGLPKKRGVVERDPRLGHMWGSPHKLNARLLVQRLGGDFRGPST